MQLQQWGEERHPALPSLPLWSTWKSGAAAGLCPHLGAASSSLPRRFRGQLCLTLCSSPRGGGGAAWTPGSAPFPKPSHLQREPRVSHSTCYRLYNTHPDRSVALSPPGGLLPAPLPISKQRSDPGHRRAGLSTARPPLTGKTSGSSLHICKNRSGRAEECSGPCGDQVGGGECELGARLEREADAGP